MGQVGRPVNQKKRIVAQSKKPQLINRSIIFGGLAWGIGRKNKLNSPCHEEKRDSHQSEDFLQTPPLMRRGDLQSNAAAITRPEIARA
jgi:hypothetical protein